MRGFKTDSTPIIANKWKKILPYRLSSWKYEKRIVVQLEQITEEVYLVQS